VASPRDGTGEGRQYRPSGDGAGQAIRKDKRVPAGRTDIPARADSIRTSHGC